MFDLKELTNETFNQAVLKAARDRLENMGATEEEYNLYKDKLINFLNNELADLLSPTFDRDYLTNYIKYSNRSYFKLNKKNKLKKADGNRKLAHFIEARIEHETEQGLIANLSIYLRQTTLNSNATNEDDLNKKAIIEKEIINFLLPKVVVFWSNLQLNQVSKNSELGTGNNRLQFTQRSYNCDKPEELTCLVNKLDVMCQLYIKNRFEKFQELKAQLPVNDQLEDKVDDNVPLLSIEPHTKYPTKLEFNHGDETTEHKDAKGIEKLQIVAQQYNEMQRLRSILHAKHKSKETSKETSKEKSNIEKYSTFREEYFKHEALLNRDKEFDGALAKILNAIKNLLSSSIRGTLSFWKSETDIVTGMLSRDYKVETTKSESEKTGYSKRSRV